MSKLIIVNTRNRYRWQTARHIWAMCNGEADLVLRHVHRVQQLRSFYVKGRWQCGVSKYLGCPWAPPFGMRAWLNPYVPPKLGGACLTPYKQAPAPTGYRAEFDRCWSTSTTVRLEIRQKTETPHSAFQGSLSRWSVQYTIDLVPITFY